MLCWQQPQAFMPSCTLHCSRHSSCSHTPCHHHTSRCCKGPSRIVLVPFHHCRVQQQASLQLVSCTQHCSHRSSCSHTLDHDHTLSPCMGPQHREKAGCRLCRSRQLSLRGSIQLVGEEHLHQQQHASWTCSSSSASNCEEPRCTSIMPVVEL
jgi:hypothetical protein